MKGFLHFAKLLFNALWTRRLEFSKTRLWTPIYIFVTYMACNCINWTANKR